MAEKAISVKNRSIDVADLPKIAEQLVQEYDDRKEGRKDLEKQWKEVDRQLAMDPEKSHKQLANGNIDPDKKWMPETELPLQSQTLESLTAEARRMIFPRGRDWFRCRAALTESYLSKFSEAESPIPGERGRFEGTINQDNADRLATAALSHYHKQYDLPGFIDTINADAFKYSFGVGRLVTVSKRILGHNMHGKATTQEIPILLPRSAWNVYLDDSASAVMHEGHEIGPNTLLHRTVKLADIKAAAQSDSSYIKSEINRLVPNKAGEVELVELEGDLVYETSTETHVIRDVVITAAVGRHEKNSTFAIIRHKAGSGNTYLVFDYHQEGVASRYGTAPLLKGAPVNRIAAQIMNRMLESGALKIAPPLGYSRDDPHFASSGGPRVHPNAQWESTEDVKVYDKVGGDPAVFAGIFSQMISMYYDVTGVNPPRLGAQTKSHTTAFAKDVEVSQGAIRTVDYVDTILEGPLERFLEMEYRIALDNWKKAHVFVKPWDEFVEISRKHLPDIVYFEAMGAGQTSEDAAAQQRKLSAVQFAMQVDNIAVQLGKESRVDHGKIIEKVLQDAGFQDVSEVITDEAPQGVGAEGQLPGLLTAPPE